MAEMNAKPYAFTDRIRRSVGEGIARWLGVDFVRGGPGRTLAEDSMNKRPGQSIQLDRERIDELTKTTKQLRQQIAYHRQAEQGLRQQIVQLEARNAELHAFAQTVAHSLQSPLSLVTGFAEFLQEDFSNLSDGEALRYLHLIEQNGHKMSRLISELLLLACVSEKAVERVPLDMGSIVFKAQHRLAKMIREYQAEIIVPEQWPTAVGYAPWVEEVWVNYLSNAMKYGGRPPQVEVGATALEGLDAIVCFWVSDNGPGLTLEEHQDLFKPFVRLDPERAAGTGLGLSIVRCIVSKLGGQVGVKQGICGGSIFSFTLPETCQINEQLALDHGGASE
jgi:two-component system sensor histidine kinase/response regulator